jgi:Protein of unknown function (DUF3443)
VPRLFLLAFVVAAQVTAQCGSSSTSPSAPGSPTASNVQSVVVNGGPNNDYINGLFTSVTVCVPGQSNCQTINGILVDTGSVGLRIVATALTLSLPQQTAAVGGGPVVECAQFQDGFTWGPVRTADVRLAGKQANRVPIQVIGEGAFSNVPAQCSSIGASENTVADLGANGILGVGFYREDCGRACEQIGSSNPGLYYTCPFGGCTVTAVASTLQLQNPVWMFSGDNNGVMIQLPSVPAGGTTTVTGSMMFGIGTQTNNALGSARVLTADAASGNFTTLFNGQTYTDSFLDSGSNGVFFLDAATTGLPACTDSTEFYCPPRTQSFSATHRGTNGATSAFTFTVGNADAIPSRFAAAVELAGPNPGGFDWGLPFFYGRTIFVAIEGQGAPGGTAPYWAY